MAAKVREVFSAVEADEEGPVEITFEDFAEHYLETDGMQSCLRELDIDTEDAKDLFNLLDIDGSGTVNSVEMSDGVLRLMGQAKAIDLAIFMHEYRSSYKRWALHAQYLEECLQSIAIKVCPDFVYENDRHDSRMSSIILQPCSSASSSGQYKMYD